MIRREVTLPQLGLIAGTRMALGVGIGLLAASRLQPNARRAAGWSLLVAGALSTIPLAATVLRKRRASDANLSHEASESREFVAAGDRAPAEEL